MNEHPFAPYVRALGRGKHSRRGLSREEAGDAMRQILHGNAQPAQIGAFLMLLRVKEPTGDELAGFLDACRPACTARLASLPAVDVDWPSYAGKRKHHPWYLAAARLLAGNGLRILMHGGPAHTPNRHYGDEMLTALGLTLPESVEQAREQLERDGLSWLRLRHFCPPLDDLLGLRFELGLRSPINTLVRCLNPAAAPLSLQSVFHPAYLRLHQEAALACGDRNLLLFKGEGGEAEVRPDARTRLTGLHDGAPFDEVLEADLPRQPPVEAVSPARVQALWRGEIVDDYGTAAIRKTTAAVLLGLGKATRAGAAEQAAARLWEDRNRSAL